MTHHLPRASDPGSAHLLCRSVPVVSDAHEGLEGANANLMGQVTLAWDDERTSRDELLAAMANAGFREVAAV